MRNLFKADVMKNSGDNWLVADFGVDHDGEHYILTTENVRASEVGAITDGAKADCELVARLLNAYHKGEIDPEKSL